MTVNIKKKFPKGIASSPPVAKTNSDSFIPSSLFIALVKKPLVLYVYSYEYLILLVKDKVLLTIE